MKTVYFVRHAESEGNARGILTGQLDLPLSPAGETASRAATEQWRKINPATVYCSTLRRTEQTARLLFPNKEPIQDARLNERHLGAWQGRAKHELQGEFPEAFLPNGRIRPDYTPPFAELWAALATRLKDFLDALCVGGHSSVVCVGHAGILRAVAMLLHGGTYPTRGFRPIPVLGTIRCDLESKSAPGAGNNLTHVKNPRQALPIETPLR